MFENIYFIKYHYKHVTLLVTVIDIAVMVTFTHVFLNAAVTLLTMEIWQCTSVLLKLLYKVVFKEHVGSASVNIKQLIKYTVRGAGTCTSFQDQFERFFQFAHGFRWSSLIIL